jgi:type IV pilus assembly protein PilM
MGGLAIGFRPERSVGLGIDIGSRVVQVAEVQRSGERLELSGIGSFTIAPGFVERGVVTDPGGMGKGIRSAIAQSKIASRRATFSVPSHVAVLRWLNLPRLPDEELREAAKFKVKRHLPFPVGDAYIEACPLSGRENDDEAEHLVIAVPRRVIDSRAEALEVAGVEPVRAELEAQAILRIVDARLRRKSPLWSDASLTIIDIGGTTTHMYVVQNRQLHFMRGVPFGSEMFVRAIADGAGVDLDTATTFLSSEGTSVDETGTLQIRTEGAIASLPLTSELEKLTREFLRLLRYFRSLHPERSYAGILDHVLLCGGMAGLRGLDAYLGTVLGLHVDRMRPLSDMVGSFDPESFNAISARQEAFTVVIGLALSGLSRSALSEGQKEYSREFIWARSA